MNEWRNRVLHSLVSEKDTAELYRLQGALKTIDEIIGIRGVVDKYIMGLKDGKMKEIK